MPQLRTLTGMAGTIHKWLALLLLLPILFWFVSGLFFALSPIERVRSEHVIAPPEPAPIPLRQAALGLARLSGTLASAERIEIRTLLGRPVASVALGKGRPILFDLESGRRLSPLPATSAAAIAERDLRGPERARRVARVTANSAEYLGPLPAWRVDFATANRSIYVAADTGVVAARRSRHWRVFDALWAAHILDFETHEDINNPLLIAASALALMLALSGIAMLPGRLGTGKRRRRSGEAGTHLPGRSPAHPLTD